jgi:Spy/CpxP family protein refolding chaperone
MMLRGILPGLDLTDEQIEAIKQVHETNQEAMQAGQKAVAEATKALHDAVLQNNEADIRAAATNLGSAIGQCALLRAATMASIKAVLTPEQQAKLEQLQSRMKQHVLGPGQPMQGLGLPGPFPGFRHQRGAGMGTWQGPGPMGLPHRGGGPGWGLDIDRLFQLRDTDKDGKLTLEELQAGGISCNLATKEVFDKIDTGKDGALSVEELEAFKEQLPARLGLGRPW